jgi:hypothetical protein
MKPARFDKLTAQDRWAFAISSPAVNTSITISLFTTSLHDSHPDSVLRNSH